MKIYLSHLFFFSDLISIRKILNFHHGFFELIYSMNESFNLFSDNKFLCVSCTIFSNTFQNINTFRICQLFLQFIA